MVVVGLLPRDTSQHLDADYSHLMPYHSVLITFTTKGLLSLRVLLYILLVLKTKGAGHVWSADRND